MLVGEGEVERFGSKVIVSNHDGEITGADDQQDMRPGPILKKPAIGSHGRLNFSRELRTSIVPCPRISNPAVLDLEPNLSHLSFAYKHAGDRIDNANLLFRWNRAGRTTSTNSDSETQRFHLALH